MKNHRIWYPDTEKEDIEEIIATGQAFGFQYNDKDYFVERGGDGFLIQDPRMGEDGYSQMHLPYIDYPGHEKAKTPEEFMALPFLDGKTIFERFDELRFFDI